jgi:hypothetical protein
MEFKFSVLFGIILAIIVLALAIGVWMVSPAYVDLTAIIMIIIFTLIFTKLYLGRVSVTIGGMVAVSIVWLIILAILDVAMVFVFGLNFTEYYSNYMIYVGYVLIIIFAVIGYKLFSGEAKPATPAPAATPPT